VRPREGGLLQDENFWLCVTTTCAQCLHLSECFFHSYCYCHGHGKLLLGLWLLHSSVTSLSNAICFSSPHSADLRQMPKYSCSFDWFVLLLLMPFAVFSRGLKSRSFVHFCTFNSELFSMSGKLRGKAHLSFRYWKKWPNLQLLTVIILMSYEKPVICWYILLSMFAVVSC